MDDFFLDALTTSLPVWMYEDDVEEQRLYSTRRVDRRSLDIEIMNEHDFKKAYRMSKGCFNTLKRELSSCSSFQAQFPPVGVGQYSSTVLPAELRMLCALWYLASEDSYRSIATNFSLNKSTVHDSVTALCKVVSELGSAYVRWPRDEEQLREMATFFERTGYPGVVGCVDGTHVNITSVDDTKYNRKKRFSFNVMLTCNSNEEIIHYNLGAPGRMNDARVYRRSELPSLVANLPSDRHILGDSAYALETGLMRPYKDTGRLTSQQKTYNHKHSSTRMVIEHAIGRLKSKWRRLKNIYVHSDVRANNIIETCIILHNFVLKHDTEQFRSNSGYFYRMPGFGNAELKRDFISGQLF